jgi:hypothetical protein
MARKERELPAMVQFLVVFSLLTAVLLASQYLSGAYHIDLSMVGDAAGHYVTSLMIHDYFATALGSNPLDFAIRYYEQYPRVALGHWPPCFYLVQAAVMGLVGRSLVAALVFQAAIAGLLGAVSATIASRAHGLLIGLATGVVVVAQPNILYAVNTVMVDNWLALFTLLSALTWAHYATFPTLSRSVLFAATATAAIMTKGNGFALALLPAFHILFSGQWSLLKRWQTWVAPALIAVVVLPWYVLTYRIVADDFMYQWGLAYARVALPAFIGMLPASLGWIGLGCFLLGATVIIARRRSAPAAGRDGKQVGISLIATVTAVLVFSFLVPTAITERYLMPLLAPAIIVSVTGIVWLAQRIPGVSASGRGLAAAAVAIFVLAANSATGFRWPGAITAHMDDAAQVILAASRYNPVVLIAGGAHAEGALIAAFAEHDLQRRYYVLRGSKVLGSANFMGTDYQPRFADTAATLSWIAEHHIGWIVLDRSPESLSMLHDNQVIALADAGQPGWHRIARYAGADGDTELYRLDGSAPTAADLEDLLKQTTPTKLIGNH